MSEIAGPSTEAVPPVDVPAQPRTARPSLSVIVQNGKIITKGLGGAAEVARGSFLDTVDKHLDKDPTDPKVLVKQARNQAIKEKGKADAQAGWILTKQIGKNTQEVIKLKNEKRKLAMEKRKLEKQNRKLAKEERKREKEERKLEKERLKLEQVRLQCNAPLATGNI